MNKIRYYKQDGTEYSFSKQPEIRIIQTSNADMNIGLPNQPIVMKLYTEEQVKKIVEKSRETGLTAEYLMLINIPIELPSDEEIEKKLDEEDFYSYEILEGAKWMRDQIQKQIQKQLLTDIMQADEKDGLYDDKQNLNK
jgi:hypothetical protein